MRAFTFMEEKDGAKKEKAATTTQPATAGHITRSKTQAQAEETVKPH